MIDCKQCQDHILDKRTAPGTPAAVHIAACSECARLLTAVQQSSALLDEFTAPEPSPFFDTRFYARLNEVKREEAASPIGFFARFRLPRFALAGALALALAFAVPSFLKKDPGPAVKQDVTTAAVDAQKGSAVADLQALENQALYAEIDLLDEIEGVVDTNSARTGKNGTKL